ncbi:CdiA C-terminal domain-containing protein [Corynebacterium sp. ZY180755]
MNRPDILLDGVDTEVKAPLGGIANTVNASLRGARKQSSQIIIDCHRTEL